MARTKRARSWRIALGSLVLVAVAMGGVALGMFVGRSTAPSVADHGTAATLDASAPVAFELNEHGQTLGDYGVGLRGDREANPELIRVVGEGGVEGYAYTVEVFGAPATTLDEAGRMTEAGLSEKTISVYEQDGTTVIGTFVANAGY